MTTFQEAQLAIIAIRDQTAILADLVIQFEENGFDEFSTDLNNAVYGVENALDELTFPEVAFEVAN